MSQPFSIGVFSSTGELRNEGGWHGPRHAALRAGALVSVWGSAGGPREGIALPAFARCKRAGRVLRYSADTGAGADIAAGRLIIGCRTQQLAATRDRLLRLEAERTEELQVRGGVVGVVCVCVEGGLVLVFYVVVLPRRG